MTGEQALNKFATRNIVQLYGSGEEESSSLLADFQDGSSIPNHRQLEVF